MLATQLLVQVIHSLSFGPLRPPVYLHPQPSGRARLTSGLWSLPVGSYLTPTLTYRLVMNVWELLDLPGLDESLARVESELQKAVASPEALLSEVAAYLVNAGGKRLRPALLLAAAASTGSGAGDNVLQGAVSVELVHMG